jgi:lipid-A-disaccharide synthase
MNVAICSGELSGDLIGGALARELKRLEPDIQLWGLGSHAMREAGVELLADSVSWGAISITEALGKVPGLLLNISPKVRRALRTRRPDVVVLIDFGAFNIRVARYSKQLGLKVCYYFPPGAWRRTGTQGAELARVTDLLAVPFPWAETRFRELGANAVYVGHPLLERVQTSMSREEFAAQFGMDPSRPIIGL